MKVNTLEEVIIIMCLGVFIGTVGTLMIQYLLKRLELRKERKLVESIVKNPSELYSQKNCKKEKQSQTPNTSSKDQQSYTLGELSNALGTGNIWKTLLSLEHRVKNLEESANQNSQNSTTQESESTLSKEQKDKPFAYIYQRNGVLDETIKLYERKLNAAKVGNYGMWGSAKSTEVIDEYAKLLGFLYELRDYRYLYPTMARKS